MKKNTKIIISVLIIFIGLCIISSNYYNTKKEEVFNEINLLYYKQNISLENNIEEVKDTKQNVLIENNTEEVTVSEEDNQPLEINNALEVEEPNEVVETPQEVTNENNNNYYYIGTIRIPSIKLEQGFVDKDFKYNNVNKNIYVHPTSTYPDVKNGNLILAAHSGTSSISYFKNLYKLNLEDDIYITYNGKEYHYKIRKIYKDKKDGTVSIKRNKDITTLTLITCTKNDKTTQTIYICELV